MEHLFGKIQFSNPNIFQIKTVATGQDELQNEYTYYNMYYMI